MEVYLHSRMLSWYSVCGIKEDILSLPVLWCRWPYILACYQGRGYFGGCYGV